MDRLHLTLAAWDYDRVRPLLDGTVRPEGIEVEPIVSRPSETFFRMLRHQEFDVSELSLSNYTMLRAGGDDRFVAIPVFPSRQFRHSCIYVNKNAGIDEPKDLIGKKVGHFGFDSGTTTFIRIIVNNLYGFDVTKEYKMVETGPAALVKLLDAGEVEAIFDFEAFVSKAIVSAPGRYLMQTHKAFVASPEGYATWITNMVAREKWLKANPKLAYAVRDAYDEAIKMLKDSNYEILRKPYITKGLSIKSDKVLDVLIENARSTPYFTNDWSKEIIGKAGALLAKMASDKILIKAVPDGVMVTLEDFIGPRP